MIETVPAPAPAPKSTDWWAVPLTWFSSDQPAEPTTRETNLLKAPLDALTHAGVYQDDELIVDLRIYWAEDNGGFIKVKVEEVV